MPQLGEYLSAPERLAIAVDTSSVTEAYRITRMAKMLGAWVAKDGLELATAEGWDEIASMNQDLNMAWIADAKLHDIPNTTAKAVENLASLEHPPVGITIHTKSGIDSLRAAKKVASEAGIMLFGVTHLTSIGDKETLAYEKALPRVVVWRESRRAAAAGIGGLVCSGQEVGQVKRFKKTNGLYTLIPGTCSLHAQSHDQKRSVTPGEAVAAGADLLVIGRQVTAAENPEQEFVTITNEVADRLPPEQTRLEMAC